MLSPGLSMLWESTDAPTAFRERFGFAELDAGVDWLTEMLATRWGLVASGCERIVISDQNAIAWVDVAGHPGAVICKWSRAVPRFERLATCTAVITAVAESGIPVARPVLSRAGEGREVVFGPTGPLSVAVQPLVEGDFLDVDDEASVREAGAQLARLHHALAELPETLTRSLDRRPDLDLPVRILGWVNESGHSPKRVAWMTRELALLPPLHVPPQIVHNDYRSANLIMRGSKVAAILDFDELALDYAVCDLAHAGVYLATLFREWGPTAPYTRQLLVDGYESVAPLTPSERAWLPFLTRVFGLIAGWPTAEEGPN
jgi:homoserine kinase type II